MAIPLALILGVGMATAQTKAGERIEGKGKIQVKTVTVDDGTLYPLAPKKGGSVTFDKGEVSYEVCDGAVCADSADFFNSTYYYWERYDINDTTWKNYAAYSKDTTFVPGEYRLVARYIRNKWTVGTVASVADRREAQERRDADFAQHSVQEVRVNGIKFDRLSCETYSLTVRSPRWRCYYTSPTITVGKSKPIVFKPICSDGTDKCGAEYSGPTKSFDGDSIKFVVKNTNQDYGWGMAPMCEGNAGWCYIEAFLSAMILPINSMETGDMESLYGTAKNTASLSLITDTDIFNAFDGGLPYAYQDTTEHADTVYYPLTLRNIDINYEKADHGTVTGPAKAHDGEILFLSIMPDDGYDLDTIYSRGMDSNNVMQHNLVPPTVGELMPDGSRFALFVAQDGFEQNIAAEFKKVGQEVTMVKPTNGTYSVTSRGKEHNASEKLFMTNAAGSTISVKPTPDAGYAVKAVTCEYEMMIEGFDNPSPAVVLLSKDSTTGLYNCAIPDASVLSEDVLNRTKQIMVKVEFAKVNDIKLDVTGLGTLVVYAYSKYDPETGVGSYCSNVTLGDSTSDAGKVCTALEGDSIIIDVEDYEGHPLKSLTCKIDGKTATNCLSSKGFKMLDKDVEIKATFKAENYELTKTGLSDDFDLYVGWGSKTPATTASQFDTVFVRSVDNKHIALPSGWRNGTFKFDSTAGIFVPYFIMGASDVDVEVTEGTFYNTVKQTIKIAGKGVIVKTNSLIGQYYMELSTDNGNEYSIRTPLQSMEFLSLYPFEGYGADTAKVTCSYVDGSEITMQKGDLGTATGPVPTVDFTITKEKDYTCEVIFTPKSYKITSTADENGVLQNVPKNGNTDAEITFKAAPLTGYEVDFVKAYYTEKDSAQKDVAVLLDLTSSYDKKKNVYTYKFTMPARDVAIEAAFKEITSSSSSAKSSSSSVKSSSSKAKSSSSSVKAKSSSSAKAKSSSSAKSKSSSSKGGKNALPAYAQAPLFSLTVMGRSVQIAGATVGSAYSVLDMQGKVIASGTIDAANVNMAMPHAGTFLVRVGNQTQTANIK